MTALKSSSQIQASRTSRSGSGYKKGTTMTFHSVTSDRQQPARFVESSTKGSLTEAHAILGKDFISPIEVAGRRKGIVYTNEQLARFVETVPSQEVLHWCRAHDHMLMAGPPVPLSVLGVRKLKTDYFSPATLDWCERQEFASAEKVDGTRWIKFRKEPVPGSLGELWEDQQLLLTEDEVVPNAAESVWCITTYKAVRNVFLFPDLLVRTASLSSKKCYIDVGYSRTGVLDIYHWGGSNKCIGLASVKK